MPWRGSPVLDNRNNIRLVLCKSLGALLERDESYAQAFLRDRPTFEIILKSVVTGQWRKVRASRVERSAGLHCIVLAFRLAGIDNFAAEMCLPLLMAGALSGVIEYPSLRDSDMTMPQTGDSQKGDWPSTQLSSAQELASHAIVNPLVRLTLSRCH